VYFPVQLFYGFVKTLKPAKNEGTWADAELLMNTKWPR
jgi:hypothetical protein